MSLIEFNLISNIETILRNRFYGNTYKQSITDLPERVNFSCPYCGDSSKDDSKKRGNFYKNTYRYKCFNCGIAKSAVSFFNDFNNLLSLNNSDFYYLKNKQTSFEQITNNISILNDINVKKFLVIKKEEVLKYFNAVSFTEDKWAKKYIINRKIPKRHYDKIYYIPMQQSLLFLDIVDIDDSQYVSCVVQRSSDFKQRYLNFNFKHLCERLNYFSSEEEKNSTDFQNFNHLSNYWNIFNINISNTIFVLEGPIDSMFFYNSIALQGLNKKLPVESGDIKYIFDNDLPGKRESIKKCKEGESVFLWKKFLQNNELPKNIKDINDIYKINNNFKQTDFLNYFSKSNLDIFWI